jgi:hypothetical protein
MSNAPYTLFGAKLFFRTPAPLFVPHHGVPWGSGFKLLLMRPVSREYRIVAQSFGGS